MAVLERCKGRHPDFVFVKDGQPMRGIDSRVWKRALREAGIEDFRWHDLRHTWASRHIQNGTTLEELQKLGGWKTYRIVLRYAHLDPRQLTRAAQRIEGSVHLTSNNAPSVQRPTLRLVK